LWYSSSPSTAFSRSVISALFVLAAEAADIADPAKELDSSRGGVLCLLVVPSFVADAPCLLATCMASGALGVVLEIVLGSVGEDDALPMLPVLLKLFTGAQFLVFFSFFF
jgi:hypothetical protein